MNITPEQLRELIVEIADPAKVSPFTSNGDMVTLGDEEIAALSARLFAEFQKLQAAQDKKGTPLENKVQMLEAKLYLAESDWSKTSQSCAELAAQNAQMREALEELRLWFDPMTAVADEAYDKSTEALALHDLAADILRKRDATTLRNAATAMRARYPHGHVNLNYITAWLTNWSNSNERVDTSARSSD